ncbi:hypothetical protein [Oceanobacillus alkalisoli]|uniref:hypothetical protein n=1 Tax=Oceanobacillus alkalisoli TaxID=2925113 RepID=UPI001EE441C8|nr:hypothetical protein [Oceanobacillus alkalisoli]MCG5104467.1 hypothetical protein [Oceanobacillus alkalisoli]
MNVMKRAWEIAREGQSKFGGKVSEYISESLKQAWFEYHIFQERVNDARQLLNEFRSLALEAKKYNPETQVIDVEEVLAVATPENAYKLYVHSSRKVNQAKKYLKQLKAKAA